jgi:hypothetical protein
MQNLDEIIRDPELYSELLKAYEMTHFRSDIQFKISMFRDCVFVSDHNRSFVVDFSMGNPYILFEVE